MITYRKPPGFVSPMNGPSGLYMEILCATGPANRLDALDFVAKDVAAAGYDLFGRGELGPPCQYGVISCTHALWFYEKLAAPPRDSQQAILDKYRSNVRRILEQIPAAPGAWPTITVPAISIHHLKGETVDWIRGMQNDLDFLVAVHDNGLFCVRAGPGSRKTLPPDLRAVMDAADDQVTHGWFLLDVDGDVVEGLPLYKDQL